MDPDYTATRAWTGTRSRPLVAATDADTGARALRTATVVRLLLYNALRVDEACAAGIAGLGVDCGHRVLCVVCKGARKGKIPLTPATAAALEACLADRARRAGIGEWWRLAGPLLATAAGGRLRRRYLWELGPLPGPYRRDRRGSSSRRIACATRRSPSPGRGRRPARRAGLRWPQRPPYYPRYDHSRDSLDRNAAYTVAAYLA